MSYPCTGKAENPLRGNCLHSKAESGRLARHRPTVGINFSPQLVPATVPTHRRENSQGASGGIRHQFPPTALKVPSEGHGRRVFESLS